MQRKDPRILRFAGARQIDFECLGDLSARWWRSKFETDVFT
jgi:hypothetical protein